MFRQASRTMTKGATLIALAVLALSTGVASAADSVTFVNDTKVPLVVQISVATPAGVRRDRPHQIFPGDKIRLSISGNKLVNVYDARLPNRVLHQGTIPASKDDLVFSLQPDPLGLPKVNLELVKPPAGGGR